MTAVERGVALEAGGVTLDGDLAIPKDAQAVVVFAHGSGSSRHSPRNRQVAAALRDAGLGTLLMDLLTSEEEQVDLRTRELRFDIGMLAARVAGATDWLARQEETQDLRVGLFGASTGAAAALVAASRKPQAIGAVVSRGGRPDLAGDALAGVRAPTLLIVGGQDRAVIGMNEEAAALLETEHHIEIVAGATHLFEEPGALEAVSEHAANWFVRHLHGS